MCEHIITSPVDALTSIAPFDTPRNDLHFTVPTRYTTQTVLVQCSIRFTTHTIFTSLPPFDPPRRHSSTHFSQAFSYSSPRKCRQQRMSRYSPLAHVRRHPQSLIDVALKETPAVLPMQRLRRGCVCGGDW